MIFWGAQNIAGERSLKYPNGTIAVKNSGTKEVGQTVSDKARTTIIKIAKLITSYAVISKNAQ